MASCCQWWILTLFFVHKSRVSDASYFNPDLPCCFQCGSNLRIKYPRISGIEIIDWCGVKPNCNLCSDGTFQNPSTCLCETCSVCSSGSTTSRTCTTSTNTVCGTCAPGTVSSGGSNPCQGCSPGYYASSAGLGSCSQCRQCPVGSIQPSWQCTTTADTVCSPCSTPATTSAVGQTSCNACVKDYFWNTAAGACAYCGRVGTTVNCPAGTYAVCPGGVQTSASCTVCTGYLSPNICTFGQEPDRVCDGGGLVNSACTNCPAGKEKKSNTVVWCTLCETGYWKAASVGAGNCLPCTKAPVGGMYTSWGSADALSRSTDTCPW